MYALQESIVWATVGLVFFKYLQEIQIFITTIEMYGLDIHMKQTAGDLMSGINSYITTTNNNLF